MSTAPDPAASSAPESPTNGLDPLLYDETARLSMPFYTRVGLTNFMALTSGFVIGAFGGGHKVARQFRAENSHRKPRSQKGWYFYHKTKNYQVMWGGIKGGLKFGGKMMVLAYMFVAAEESLDRMRGRIDAVSTVVASTAMAGIFSVAQRFSRGYAVRTMKRGVVLGVAYGLVQDGIRKLKGQKGGIFEHVSFGRKKEETAEGFGQSGIQA